MREKLASEPESIVQRNMTFEQLELLDNWIEGVQDVNTEDIELSNIWQNLLARAAQGRQTPVEVIEVLKSITPREAKYLSEFDRRGATRLLFGSPQGEFQYLARSLESKGILERDYRMAISFIVSLIMTGFLSYYLAEALHIFRTQWITMIVAFAGALITSAILLSAIRRWQLSWLGEELFRLVQSDFPRQKV